MNHSSPLYFFLFLSSLFLLHLSLPFPSSPSSLSSPFFSLVSAQADSSSSTATDSASSSSADSSSYSDSSSSSSTSPLPSSSSSSSPSSFSFSSTGVNSTNTTIPPHTTLDDDPDPVADPKDLEAVGLIPDFCTHLDEISSGDWTDDPPRINGTDQLISGIDKYHKFATKPPYARYEEVPTVVVVNGIDPRTNTSGITKIVFYPELDTLSLLHVVNSSQSSFLDGKAGVRIRVEQQTAASGSRRRLGVLDGSCRFVVPYWTLIVNVDKGNITGYDWDDDCTTCPKEQCINGNCGVPLESCTDRGGDIDCDLKIYVCWRGTDRGGNRLTSAGRRLSTFRQWSLNAAYSAAAKFADQSLPKPPDEIPAGGQTVPGRT